MLIELRILDFAIIDKLEVALKSGLLVFTGETGAGKSIIMDAVEMLLGGKVDASVIRAEEELARVEGVFSVDGEESSEVFALLKREDLLDDGNFITISREVRREGRSSARINGRIVNQTLLRELGGYLVDIHGQSEHLSLLDTKSHLDLLDRYAKLDDLQTEYHQDYLKIRQIRKELAALRVNREDSDRRIELLTYQADEIEKANLQAGEEEELQLERDRLANAESLSNFTQEAITLLDEATPDSPAANDLIGQAIKSIGQISRLDSSQADLADLAIKVEEELSEIVRSLKDYLEGIEYNPRRLEVVEERLNLIQSLKRKYGGSIDAIQQFGAKARMELADINNADDRISTLEKEEGEVLAKLSKKATALSESRKNAATKMSESIEKELENLRMASAHFKVEFSVTEDPDGLPMDDGKLLAFDTKGMDKVEFFVAPNPGEGLKPLVKIASGGETSRLMLALKNVLAKADRVPTLIFDEIDQGIGGRVGTVVGEKLWQLGNHHQVMVITHLPQLAAFGDHQWQVKKVISAGRTVTQVNLLKGEKRTLELASMLGEVTEGTLRSAHDILQMAKSTKEQKKNDTVS
ncbi:MAG TPA: DNA repair protein RecN [Anaerolineales bacterium]|nr:DNA repair protein RecN [Anaerolineales bacterium]